MIRRAFISSRLPQQLRLEQDSGNRVISIRRAFFRGAIRPRLSLLARVPVALARLFARLV